MNELDAMRLIGKLNKAQNKLGEEIDSCFFCDELHGMQAVILYYIIATEEKKNVYLRDIAAEFGLSYAAVSQMLKKLKLGGYIVDSRESDDARLRRLTTTEKARRFKSEIERRRASMNELVLKSYTPEELDMLCGLLDRF